MTDQDGNTYKTVTIGNQTWMAENLRTTKYNDGTPIAHITNEDEWGYYNGEYSMVIPGQYCTYNNTINEDTITTYGFLYNWFAVNTGKLAPKGWHVPTNDEWTILADYLGGQYVAGNRLKETGNAHWLEFNTRATNVSGFTALPGGFCSIGGLAFYYIGYFGGWWSTTEGNTASAYYRCMEYKSDQLDIIFFNKKAGFSVRCVKD